MHKRIMLMVTLALGLFLAGCSPFGGAMQGSEVNGEFVERFVERFSDRLNLNADQSAKLRAAVDDMTATAKGQKAEREALKARFAEEVGKETLDQAALTALMDEQHALNRAVVQSAMDGLAELHATLNAEQRAELAAALTEPRERGERRGFFGGRRS
ncbi:MAG: Spy/CpxP family protein refolding chaperone [Desulfovibrionaceae bacterium]